MQTVSSQMTINQITNKINNSLPLWYGNGSRLATPQPLVEQRTYSFLLHYQVDQPRTIGKDILVKIDRLPVLEDIDAALAAKNLYTPSQKIYAMMKKMEHTIQDAGLKELGSIHMLSYLPQWNAIVMEKFSGRTLKTHFSQIVKRPWSHKHDHKLESAFLNAGKWLRIFHSKVGELGTRPFSAAIWMKDVHKEIEKMLPRIQGTVNIDRLIEKFEHAAARFEGHPVQYSTIHGDFHMNNILLGEDGTMASFDPNAPKLRPVYRDLTRMAADPVTVKTQVLSRGLLVRKPLIEKCRAALFAGYFGGEIDDPEFFNLSSAFTFLKKWRDDEYQMGSYALNKQVDRRLVSPYVRSYFLRRINTKLDSLIG